MVQILLNVGEEFLVLVLLLFFIACMLLGLLLSGHVCLGIVRAGYTCIRRKCRSGVGTVETGYSHQGSDKSDHGDDVVPDTTEENDVDLGEWKIVERKKYKARNSVGMLDEDQHAHTRSRI